MWLSYCECFITFHLSYEVQKHGPSICFYNVEYHPDKLLTLKNTSIFIQTHLHIFFARFLVLVYVLEFLLNLNCDCPVFKKKYCQYQNIRKHSLFTNTIRIEFWIVIMTTLPVGVKIKFRTEITLPQGSFALLNMFTPHLVQTCTVVHESEISSLQ